MSQQLVEKNQEVSIPKALATRIRKIAPYGQNGSIDAFISSMLDEFVSQLENKPISRKYNPFTEKDLEKVREEIKCFSLYP
jgi:hypothetical protein